MIIKVDLSNFITNSKQFAIVYIDFELMKTVADVIHQICTINNLSRCEADSNNFSLYEDIWYIPSNQSSSIFKDINGIIRLFPNEETNKKTELNCESCENSTIISNNQNDGESSEYSQTFSNSLTTIARPISNEDNQKQVCVKSKEVESLFSESNKHEFVVEQQNSQENISPVKETLSNNACLKTENYISAENMVVIESPIEETWNKKQAKKNLMIEDNPITNEGDIEVEVEKEKKISSDLVNSFFSENDLSNNFVKKKRKKKHNKAKKKQKLKLLNGEEEKRIECSMETDFEYEKINISCDNKTQDKQIKRIHKIFDLGDDEKDSQSNLNDEKLDSEDHTKNYKRMDNISNHRPKRDRYQYESASCSFDAYAEPKHRAQYGNENWNYEKAAVKSKRKSFDRIRKSNTNLSCLSDDRNFGLKSTNVDPPVGCYNFPEPSPDVKAKFQKLLTLEFNYNPKVFTKTRYSLNSHAPNYVDHTWNSLPRSFASRKEKDSTVNEEIISLNTMFCNEPLKNIASDAFSKNIINDADNSSLIEETTLTNVNSSKSEEMSCTVDSSIKEEEEKISSQVSFIGAKPPKKNKRYIQSLGNTLSFLKNLNKSHSKTTNIDSIQDKSKSISPEILTNNLNSKVRITQFVNRHSYSPQSRSFDSKIEENIDNTIQNKSLSELHSHEQIDEKNISSLPMRTSLWDVDSSSTGFVEREERNEDYSHNVDKEEINKKDFLDSNAKNSVEVESYTKKNSLLQPDLATNVEEGKYCNISYESYPLLESFPIVGAIIATKLPCEDESLCAYRRAKVIHADGGILNLQFLDKSDASCTNIEDEEIATVDWRDLKSTRLLNS